MNQHAAAPEFAMSFTQEAVMLERREGRDWRPLGQARFAEDDLSFVLNTLRDEAGGQRGEPDTVLVIPDDQILYTSLTVPFGSDTPATIARALEAITPYGAEELVFDWCPAANGDIETLRVAAVARRTLIEAEEFARAQGFRPCGFQARPQDDRFDGQPDFGGSHLPEAQFDRRPFSGPDLSHARVTAPVIELDDDISPAGPVVSRVVPHVAVSGASAAPIATSATAETTRPVIRHGQRVAADPSLSPRAKAVHERAASARGLRADPASAAPVATSALTWLARMDWARLPVMVGVLALAIALGLLFLGRDTGQPQLAATPDTELESQLTTEQLAAETAEPALPEIAVNQIDTAPIDTAEAQVDAVVPETASAPAAPDMVGTETVENDGMATSPTLPEAGAATDTAALPDARPVAVPAAITPETDAIPSEDAPTEPVQAQTAPDQDALTRALNEALAAGSERTVEPVNAQFATAPAARPATIVAGPATAPETASETAPAAAPARPISDAVRLTASQRPPRATPVRAEAPAAPDARPTVPEAAAPAATPAAAIAPRPLATAARPPSRPATRPATATQPAPAAATPPATVQTTPEARPTAPPASGRPPARPDDLSALEEGSRLERDATRLTQSEQALIMRQLRDLRTAQVGATGMTEAERGLIFQLADARPTRKPVAISGPTNDAVRAAVTEAMSSDRPQARAGNASTASLAAAAAAPSAPTAAASTGLARSTRPQARPASASRAGASASLSPAAVEEAIAEAVTNSAATPGAVALTSLSSSALPPRRSGGARQGARIASTVTSNAMLAAAPVAAAAATAPSAADLRAAAEGQATQDAIAAQRRMDGELQAQAEARARAHAAADARADAQARAQAEARARAQAEAEARTAAARNQTYKPQEVDNEPDVVAAIPQGAIGNAAATATVKDGIRLNSTQIIGTIGAGQASRALVRLSNGRILTLRIGDRINGGTITEIRDSRILYNRNGQIQALGVLNGQ